MKHADAEADLLGHQSTKEKKQLVIFKVDYKTALKITHTYPAKNILHRVVKPGASKNLALASNITKATQTLRTIAAMCSGLINK